LKQNLHFFKKKRTANIFEALQSCTVRNLIAMFAITGGDIHQPEGPYTLVLIDGTQLSADYQRYMAVGI
jgi:hypothetical protein